MSDATPLMDKIDRRQRHIYDLSRKYYLLGRDEAIARLRPAHGDGVLEIGCGTGRNLIKAARTYPAARFYGLDVSRAMLDTAAASIAPPGSRPRSRSRWRTPRPSIPSACSAGRDSSG
jgi:S-adenosylmethionine-diacylgycerolhomoserine-N-methlytransferase